MMSKQQLAAHKMSKQQLAAHKMSNAVAYSPYEQPAVV
jgi:hypothetical protein